MADDKTTKTPEQPVTDSGPGKETPPAPPKEPEKVSVSPEPEKKTEPEVKNPQVSVYNFAEIMKEKKVEERSAAPSGEKPAPAKTEKPEKQPEAPKKAEEKPKEPEQPKRRGRPPKADKDKAAAPKPKTPAQKPENAVKKEPEKKTAPTVQAAPAPKEPEKPKDAPRRGKEQIVYIKLNELHAFKNHPFEVRDDEEMRAMVSSVKDKGVTQPAIVRPREDGGYEIVSGHRPVFEQYKAMKYSRKFLAEHEADLELYRAAQAEMRSLLGGAKLPKMDVLKEEGRKLTAKKKQLYGEYQKARRDMQELVTIKANIDTLMGYTGPGRKQEKER